MLRLRRPSDWLQDVAARQLVGRRRPCGSADREFAACVIVPKAAGRACWITRLPRASRTSSADFETRRRFAEARRISTALSRSTVRRRTSSAPVRALQRQECARLLEAAVSDRVRPRPYAPAEVSLRRPCVPLSMRFVGDEALATARCGSRSRHLERHRAGRSRLVLRRRRGRAGISLSGTWIGGHPDRVSNSRWSRPSSAGSRPRLLARLRWPRRCSRLRAANRARSSRRRRRSRRR